MELIATYDSHDITLDFMAVGIATDYGVRGSDHIEVNNIELHTVTIAGQSFDPCDLPTALTDALLVLAAECEFEPT